MFFLKKTTTVTVGTDHVKSVTLPFTFIYNHRPYNSILISTNGFVAFGALASLSSSNITPISNTTDPTNYDGAIVPVSGNLVAATGAGRVPEIRTQEVSSFR